MKKVSILIPVQEYLNSYGGGAIARWIYHIYNSEKHNFKFYILGRILNDHHDFESTSSLQIVSRYNTSLKILTRLPVIRTIFKPFISSIYLKIYIKNIRSSEILEVHNAVEYISIIRKMKFIGKIILHMHNDYLNKLNQESIEILNSEVNLLIFPSKALKREFLTMHPEFTKPIRVVYNGYDPKKFFPQQEMISKPNPIIGYVGRFDKNKNILNLLDVYSALLDKIPNLEFYLIGSGKFGGTPNKYQRLVLKKIDTINKHNGHITYLGYVHNDELVKYYNLFDLFISLPVHTEAFGMTFVESLACKTLAVGTNLGGIPEAIGAKELLVNNPLDHLETTDKIFYILTNEALKKSLKEKTFSHVSMNFQWDVIQAEQFKVLEQLDKMDQK